MRAGVSRTGGVEITATGKLLRVFLGCTLGLLLAEVGIRVWLDYWPDAGAGVYVRDPVAGYRLRPEPAGEDSAGNDQHVNALGFRDHEHAVVKPAGTRRILGIGDSFVFGAVSLDENFLRVAERELNSASLPGGTGGNGSSGEPVPSTEMILMGLGGYSPLNYLGVLRGTGLALQPDLVLLCFFVGNDVTGIATRNQVYRGHLFGASSANAWLNLARRSRLLSYLEREYTAQYRRGRVRSENRPSGWHASSTRVEPDRPPLSRLYLSILRNRLPYYAVSSTPSVDHLWARAESALDAFDRSCRRAGVSWALVLIPDEVQVDAAIREEALERLRQSAAALDFDAPQRRLADWAVARGVPALDLLPLMRGETEGHGSLYIPSDTHWNQTGNRIAGHAVARFIRDLSLLAPASIAPS